VKVGGEEGVLGGIAVGVGLTVAIGVVVLVPGVIAVPVAAVPGGLYRLGGVGVRLSGAGIVAAVPLVVLVLIGNGVGVGVTEGVGVGGKETIVSIINAPPTVAAGVTCSCAASIAAWAPTLGFSGANRTFSPESAP
jgi:hypothetical protein